MLPVGSKVKSGFFRGCFSLRTELPCRGASSTSISSAADTGRGVSSSSLVKWGEMVQTNTNSNPVCCSFLLSCSQLIWFSPLFLFQHLPACTCQPCATGGKFWTPPLRLCDCGSWFSSWVFRLLGKIFAHVVHSREHQKTEDIQAKLVPFFRNSVINYFWGLYSI